MNITLGSVTMLCSKSEQMLYTPLEDTHSQSWCIFFRHGVLQYHATKYNITNVQLPMKLWHGITEYVHCINAHYIIIIIIIIKRKHHMLTWHQLHCKILWQQCLQTAHHQLHWYKPHNSKKTLHSNNCDN